MKTKTKTLLKGTKNELKVTEIGNKIIVENKEDLRLKEIRKQQINFLFKTGTLIFFSVLLGGCLTYLMMTI